jgi:hypothetical protein
MGVFWAKVGKNGPKWAKMSRKWAKMGKNEKNGQK